MLAFHYREVKVNKEKKDMQSLICHEHSTKESTIFAGNISVFYTLSKNVTNEFTILQNSSTYIYYMYICRVERYFYALYTVCDFCNRLNWLFKESAIFLLKVASPVPFFS
ncbi:hypothetical protein SK128_021241 [Halocaridina rubra]|uniref:Uncharacterized protein n=1 Tax=Halocaridina rubra TaxID=373956 RepID=A0AAN8ZVD0_HALRR